MRGIGTPGPNRTAQVGFWPCQSLPAALPLQYCTVCMSTLLFSPRLVLLEANLWVVNRAVIMYACFQLVATDPDSLSQIDLTGMGAHRGSEAKGFSSRDSQGYEFLARAPSMSPRSDIQTGMGAHRGPEAKGLSSRHSRGHELLARAPSMSPRSGK